MCVPPEHISVSGEHICVFQVYTCVCALQKAHVGFPAQHMYARAAGENICVLTGAHLRAPRVLFQLYTYVFHMYAHTHTHAHMCLSWTCVSELPL